MLKYAILLNDTPSYDVGVSIVSRPSIPTPVRKYREIEIGGKNGKLYEDLGTYDDIEITVKCNFASKKSDSWNEDYRRIKEWIKGVETLTFSDDLNYFYKVNKVTIDSTERALKRLGRFNLVINCKPFSYLKEGQQEITLPSGLYNDYEATQPIYKVTGEGVITLTVNGVSATANVGQNLIINTEKGLCYRTDGTTNNTALTAEYEDLFLQEGNNTFAYTTGFTVNIIPNWRCL